jgi:hypothetical protein
MAGRLGYQDSSGNWVLDVPGWPYHVYVRMGRDEETATLHKVLNHAVAPVPDLPVWVERTAEGTLAIVGVRAVEYQVFAGGTRTGATVAPHTHEPGGGMVDPVSVRRIKPGLVRAYKDPTTGQYGMLVYIEPFALRHQGIDKYWPGGTINLTAYLPATANTHRWVKVGLDPDTLTPVAVAGPEKSGLVDLSAAELGAISFQSYIPCGGVKLAHSQTAISRESDFLDFRPWWSVTGGTGTFGASIELWNPDQTPAQAEDENDEFDDGSLAGKWTEFDSGSIQTPTESGGALALAQTSQATATLTGVYQTLPAGDFTIAVKLALDADTPSGDGQAWQAGIALWENAASDTAAAFLVGPAVEQVAGSARRAIGWSTWAGHDDLTLPYWDSQGFAWEAGTALYLRLRRTGTEYHLDWGPDGETWYTSPVMVDFTPAQVGIGLYNKASGVAITGSFEFFRRRATYDALTAPVYGGIDLSAGKLGELGDVDLETTPPNDGQALLFDDATDTWIPGDAGGVPLAMWTMAGNQTPVASPLRIYNTSGITRTIAKVFISANTPPTGSALIVDVHKNGTTIFTNQANRPQIADGQYTGQSTSIDVTGWAPGDYLTVEVDQVGSTTPGADLTVHIAFSDAGGGGGGSGTDTTAIHTNTANEIAGLTEKVSPVSADLLVIEDSAAGNVKKKVQTGNLPLANHDHSGDAGDGGTFDAANLASGEATDGHVLTADGLGGAAWEAPVGGEDPNAIHDNADGEINAITEKATPANADLVLVEDSAASYAKKKVKIGNLPGGGGGGGVPQAYIAGFEVDYDGTNLTIQPGVVRNDADNYTLIKTTTITIDPAANGADGLDTGSLAAGTWYAIWVIAKSSDGTTSGLMSTSFTKPVMPDGYDKKRRVGAVKTIAASATLHPQMTMRGHGIARKVHWMDSFGDHRPYNNVNIATYPNWTTIDLSAHVAPTSTICGVTARVGDVDARVYWRRYGDTTQGRIELVYKNYNQDNVDNLPLDSSQRGEVTNTTDINESLSIMVRWYEDNLLPTIVGSSG